MYLSSELSRTKNEPSALLANFASASSQISGPQYQPTLKKKHYLSNKTGLSTSEMNADHAIQSSVTVKLQSNTFGTMKISSRQGSFEPMSVNHCARSEGIIGISFRFSLT